MFESLDPEAEKLRMEMAALDRQNTRLIAQIVQLEAENAALVESLKRAQHRIRRTSNEGSERINKLFI